MNIIKNKDYKREYNKRWREAHKHLCIDCGRTICVEAIRCLPCSKKGELNLNWKGGCSLKYPCKGCGKLTNSVQHLCHSCAMKQAWALGRMPPKKKMESFIDFYGYIHIYRPNHLKASKRGYVKEHILVWELTHGKTLPKYWIVHHLNSIKGDNRPMNLIAMPTKKHILLIPELQKRIQKLEAQLNNQGQFC